MEDPRTLSGMTRADVLCGHGGLPGDASRASNDACGQGATDALLSTCRLSCGRWHVIVLSGLVAVNLLDRRSSGEPAGVLKVRETVASSLARFRGCGEADTRDDLTANGDDKGVRVPYELRWPRRMALA
jgi:hypothetical protein